MTMTEGKVVRWMVTEGGHVGRERPLVTIETDKITYEMDAPASGFLHILVSEGEMVSVGEVLGLIAGNREEYETIASREREHVVRAASEERSPSSIEQPSMASRVREKKVKVSPRARKLAQAHGINVEELRGSGPGGRIVEEDIQRAVEMSSSLAARLDSIKITPIARAIAEDKGIDISQLKGSGPGGRIEKKDVLKAASGISKTEVLEEKRYSLGSSFPLSRMREVIAERLTASSRDIPHIYLQTQVDATQMISLRDAFSEQGGEPAEVRVSLTDIVIVALARNIEAHPLFNATLVGKKIEIQPEINIGLAVALDEGLIVPVISQANRKGLREIARCRSDLVERARRKKLTKDEIAGSTITLSSLGGFDIDFFTPIINPPEAAILSMAKIEKRVVVVDDRIEIRPVFNLGLTADHRIIDGAMAASFLQDLRKLLMNPYMLFGGSSLSAYSPDLFNT